MMAAALVNSPVARTTGNRCSRNPLSIGPSRRSVRKNICSATYSRNNGPVHRFLMTEQLGQVATRKPGVCSALADPELVCMKQTEFEQ